ncbi:MAG: iron-containing alcohol dehydrogenase [Limnochordia bacterium]|jgi:alcohol dehydrogenase class IV
MQVKEIRLPARIITGMGSLEKLAEVVGGMGKKALIVSDKVVTDLGYLDKVKDILGKAKATAAVYNEVNQEPTNEHVEAGLKILKDEGCDFLIAIGGGSAIDAAKAIGMMATNPGSISDYMGQNKAKNPTLPMIAVPTTAGTGSEVTRNTIITDLNTNVKMLIGSPYLIPDVAIDDPALTMTMPQGVTSSTGLDALTHAIEGYVSKQAQPITDEWALSAIRLIAGNLRQAWANGSNEKARSNMMLGQLMAGMAFSNSSVALVHGMARPIGAFFHVAHGLSNAVLLPHVMRFSWIGDPVKFARITEAMGEDVEGLSVLDAAELAADAVERLCADLNVPTYQEMGLDEKKYFEVASQMAKDAIASGSPAHNPRVATEEEIVEIYRLAYYGG